VGAPGRGVFWAAALWLCCGLSHAPVRKMGRRGVFRNASSSAPGKAGRVPCDGVRFCGGCQAGVSPSAGGVLAVAWGWPLPYLIRRVFSDREVFAQWESTLPSGRRFFRLAMEQVRRPTPRAADPPVGGGNRGRFWLNWAILKMC